MADLRAVLDTASLLGWILDARRSFGRAASRLLGEVEGGRGRVAVPMGFTSGVWPGPSASATTTITCRGSYTNSASRCSGHASGWRGPTRAAVLADGRLVGIVTESNFMDITSRLIEEQFGADELICSK